MSYIIASADTDVGSITSPVGGLVDLLTAWITCMSVEWLGVTGAGNAQGLGVTGSNVVKESNVPTEAAPNVVLPALSQSLPVYIATKFQEQAVLGCGEQASGL